MILLSKVENVHCLKTQNLGFVPSKTLDFLKYLDDFKTQELAENSKSVQQ